MTLPPSTDARWATWCRPLAALLRIAPRTRAECARFAASLATSSAHAECLLPWLELEYLARADAGLVALTSSGEAWLGDYRIEFALVPRPARRPRTSVQRGEDLRDRPPFDRLRPVERAGRTGCGHALWRCACACGGECIVTAGNLLSGNTRSCGCLRMEKRESGLPPIQWRAA